MPYYGFTSYAEAATYMKHGRKKHVRPLYTSGMYMRFINGNGDLGVFNKWSNQDFVIYHRDDSITIQAQPVATWGNYHPLLGQGLRDVIRRFAHLEGVYKHNHKFYILPQDHDITPAKIQKCRACHGSGKIDEWCYISRCYSEPCEEPNAVYSVSNRLSLIRTHIKTPHTHLCEHGEKEGHTIPKGRDCYYCNGAGKRDYGSKPVGIVWDGSPIRLRDGKLVNQIPTDLEKAIAAYVKTG